ncbi:MAG TPA: ATP-binding protein [Desulfobacterales bacterium]|nr:ATP-binding protein [Desulfobacterales bacterium]
MTVNAQKSGEENKPDKTVKIVRREQTNMPLNVAFVGGGKACYDLLKLLDKARLTRLKMKILGVADIDPRSPGLVYAKKHNLFTTNNFQDLYSLKELNLLIELTGSSKARESILRTKPAGISIVDYTGARFLWDLIQMEIEKTELEKKRQEQEEKEKKYTQIILDSLPYRIMVVNMDKTIERVNQTFLNEFNLTYEGVLGKYCYEVRYGLEKSCGESGYSCCLLYLEEIKEKKLISTFREFRGEKGEERVDVITVAPIYNERGDIVQIVEASRDVTARIKLEQEVEKSNTFFQNVIQSTVDGIVVVDTKGNVLIFNEGMERLTGYNAREIMERGHLASFYNIDVARENMIKMRSDEHGPVGKLNPTSMSITTKDGEDIPVTLSASIIKIDEKEVGSVGVFTDMREILKMRKDLEEAHFQLVQSEKIASVGKMAAGVAHEINNPLAGIMMYAELLKENFIDNSQHSKDIQEIIDQTLRCKKIVSELLEFSRQTVGKASSFSIEQIITKTLNLLINQALFQDIEVKKIIQSDMPEMTGDLGQLQQVFTNLFINAADAMKGKGKLNISAKYDSSRNLLITTVSDSGPGIPKELRDKIFDMFFTTKPVGKGTGLGLSISQKIINLHGGNILVDSPPEGGTRFIIELPLGFVEQPDEEPVFIGLDEA